MTDDFQLTHPTSTVRYNLGKADFFPTPADVTRVLLESDVSPPRDTYLLDPTAGEGDLLEACKRAGYDKLSAVDLRPECEEKLLRITADVKIGDWLDIAKTVRPQVMMTNPPFSIAQQIARACIECNPYYLALLMRTEVLGAPPWRAFWAEHMCTAIRTVPWRIRFDLSKPGTDFYNHSWFVWQFDLYSPHVQDPLNIRPGPDVRKR
jgi:hypothetical protein